METIDTGDSVLHGPTGETWLVAHVDGDRLYWCGWPPGCAALSDCALTEKATPEAREKLIRDLAAMRPDNRSGYDARQAFAARRLADSASACPYGQCDCESTRGGVCVCTMPPPTVDAEHG